MHAAKRLTAAGITTLTLLAGLMGVAAPPAAATYMEDAGCPLSIASQVLGSGPGGATIAYNSTRTSVSTDSRLYPPVLTFTCTYMPSSVVNCPAGGACVPTTPYSWTRYAGWNSYYQVVTWTMP